MSPTRESRSNASSTSSALPRKRKREASSVGEHSPPTLAIGNNCGEGTPGGGVQHRCARIASATGRLAGKLFMVRCWRCGSSESTLRRHLLQTLGLGQPVELQRTLSGPHSVDAQSTGELRVRYGAKSTAVERWLCGTGLWPLRKLSRRRSAAGTAESSASPLLACCRAVAALCRAVSSR